MFRLLLLVVPLTAVLIGSGCTRSTNALSINTQPTPQPLPSTPSGSVQSTTLDPITDTANQTGQEAIDQTQQAVEETVEETVEVAALEQPKVSTEPLTHENLAGAWNVASDSATCRVFLSFTKWSGGYRAGSRQCQSGELASVNAWDVRGSSVILMDANGNQVANLGSIGTERYAGKTSGGQPVSFSR